MSSAPFFCPWDLSRQSILFCSFSCLHRFQKSKDCISTRLPHPSRHFSAICGYPAGRAAGRADGRTLRERGLSHGTAVRSLGRLGQPRSGRRPRPRRDLETHGVGQAGAFGEKTDDEGGSSIQIPIWRSLRRLRGRSPSFGVKGTRSSWTWTTCSPSGAPPGTRGGTR